jgi:hypothetical protein
MMPRATLVSLFVLCLVWPAVAIAQPAQVGVSGAALYTE